MTTELRGPANSPIFDPPRTSGATKNRIPAGLGAAIYPWSHPGIVTPYATFDGPKMYVASSGQIGDVYVTLQTAATVNYTVGVVVDDVEVAQVILPSGSEAVSNTLNSAVSIGSYFWTRLYQQNAGDGTTMSILVFLS